MFIGGIFLSYFLSKQTRIIKKVSYVIWIVPLAIYFAFHPIYEGDFSNKYRKIVVHNKLLNSIPLEPTREIINTYELCYNYINQLIEDNLNNKILDDILQIAYKIDYDFSNKYEYYKSFCIIYKNKNKAENVISNYRECIESGRFNDYNDRVEKNLIQVFNSFRGIPKSQINQILSDFEKWL